MREFITREDADRMLGILDESDLSRPGPAGDHVLVVWRDLEVTDNAALNELFLKQRINIRDREFDLIYVNGDNNLENIRLDDESWKVRLIDHEFIARMFAEK